MKIKKLFLSLFVVLALFNTSLGIQAEEPTPVDSEKVDTPSLLAVVDKTALQAQLEEAKLIDADSLLKPSKDIFSPALEIAQTTNENPTATEEEVLDATSVLESALAGVEYKASEDELAALQVVYDEASLINPETLEEESAKDLDDAMLMALPLLDSANEVPQEEVLAATNNLRTTLEGLIEKPVTPLDTSKLSNAITEAGKIKVTDKEEPGKTRFLLALSQAREELSKEELTQESIDSATLKLVTAQENLVTITDYQEPGVIDSEKLTDEDIIERPVFKEEVIVEEEKEVLPLTGMGSMGIMASNSMVLVGLSMILVDKKNRK